MIGMHHECVATTIRLMAGQDPPYELYENSTSIERGKGNFENFFAGNLRIFFRI